MTTLRALECLVALVETGSVTGAATSLELSQPALSHQIATLEKELGTPLTLRLGRGVRVTAAGLAAAEEARVALRAAERAVRIGRRVGAGENGRLRIACTETMTAWLLGPVLELWRTRHTGVVLELTEHPSSGRMAELVAGGGADLAISPRPPDTNEHVERLGEEEVVAVAPAGHRFGERPSVPIGDLAGEPFVHYTPDSGLCGWVDRLAAEHHVRLDPVLRVRSPRTAAQLAAGGTGVAVVPVSALGSRPAGVVRRFTPPIRREIVAIVASPSDALVTRFVDDVRGGGPQPTLL